MLIYNHKDAITDSYPHHCYGIDFDLEWNSAVLLEVTDILTKRGVVYQPIIESI